MSDISGVAQVAVEANLDAFTASAVAIGNLVSDAIEFGLKKAGDFLKTLPAIGQELQDAQNAVLIKTGQTGDALLGLQGTVAKIGTETPQKFGDIANSVSILSDRFKTTNTDALQPLAENLAKMASFPGFGNLSENTDKIAGVFKQFNIPLSQSSDSLNTLYKTTQVAGIGMSDLVPTMNSIAASSAGIGMSFQDTAAFAGSFAQLGLNATQSLLAMGKVAKLSQKDGISTTAEWNKLMTTFKTSPTAMQAFADGAQIVGTRAARLGELVQSGALDIQGMSQAISDNTNTIQGNYAATDTLGREWKITLNQVKEAAASSAIGLNTALMDVLKQLQPVLTELISGVGAAIGPAISQIAAVLGPGIIEVLKALEPVLSSVANLFATVFTDAKPLIDAFAGALTTLAPVLSQIIDGIAGALGPAIAQLAPVVTSLANAFLPVVQALGGAFVTVIKALAPAFVAIAQAIVPIADKLGKDFAQAIIQITPLLPQLVNDFTQLVIAALQVVESGLLELFINLLPPVTQLVTWIANLTAAFLSHKEVMEPLAVIIGAVFAAFKGFEFIAKAQGALQSFNLIAESTGSKTTATFLAMQGESENASTTMVSALTLITDSLDTVNANLETMVAALTQLNDTAITTAGGLAPLDAELGALNLELVPLTAEIDLTSASLDGLTVSEDAAAASGGALEAVLAILAAPVTLIVIAVAALGAAIYEAYQHFGPFHDAVDSLGSLISGTFMTAWHDVSDFVTNDVLPWVKELPGDISNLWDSFVNSGPVKAVLDDISKAGQALADAWNNNLKPAIDKLWTALQPLIQAFEDLWNNALKPLVDAISGALATAIQWMIDHWQIFAGILAVVLAPLTLVAGVIYEVATHFDFFKGILTTVIDALGPFIATMISISGGIIADVINVITGLVDILTGLFTLDFGKVVDGISSIGGALWDFFVTLPQKLIDGIWTLIQNLHIPELLGKLFTEGLPALGGMIWDAIKAAFDWIVTNGPGILEAVYNWVVGLPGQIIGWLGDLGSLLGGWFLDAFDWVVKNGLSLLGDLIGWVILIPVEIYRGLKELGPKLWDAFKEGFQWIVDNGPGILESVYNWVTGLPAQIIGWLGSIGDLVKTWWKDGWDGLFGGDGDEGLVAEVKRWVGQLPGKIIGWLGTIGNLVKTWWKDGWDGLFGGDGDEGLVAEVKRWMKELPGKMIGWLGDFGSMVKSWITDAFNTVVTDGPKILDGLLKWFGDLPGKIFDAIKNGLSSAGGAVADIAGDIWNGIKGFLNDHLINPIHDFRVSLPFGQGDFTPFAGLKPLADGAFVQRATQAIIGEAGPEVVIPLSRPKRAQQLAQESGLNQVLGQGSGGGNTIINVTVEATPDTTAAQATMVGQTAGQAIRRAIEPAVRNG